MHRHTARVSWLRNGAAFTDNRYSRGHRWHFDGGVDVPASASPHVVPLPMSVQAAVDPEGPAHDRARFTLCGRHAGA